ncbi:MAG TPA: TIGR04053 family radical SAM/SPASM domain-containing protein [Candidatus Binatia bacterium]|nr:TIGR04053 family radical SAM/SPASM domain-containing protein [Candidatus Binatia bacterium]
MATVDPAARGGVARRARRAPALLPAPRFEERPILVYWEVTRACALACRHCRAEAIPKPTPGELDTVEGRRLLEMIAGFGRPLPRVVLTGGDPLERADLFELIATARELGLAVSLTPSVTPNLRAPVVSRLAAAGIDSIALSLDGSTAARHDAIRGIPGTFAATLEAARSVRSAGLGLQINTLVAEETVDDLPAIARLVAGLDIIRWSLFFLVPVGRGRLLQGLDSARAERVLRWLVDLSRTAPFAVKATEAMHVRRIAVQRLRRAGWTDEAIARTDLGRGFGINDGRGIVFVSAEGRVYPSGFLPLPVGDVRARDLVAIYREAELLRRLRNPDALTGKCGACEFRAVCGGSRARAYAATGDALAADPLCPYEPPAWRRRRRAA